MSAFLALLLTLQQPAEAASPASDTSAYWQQEAHYWIVATLDERAATLHATGELLYINHSPDTLREMYFHQYLNAFRPGSKWSADDEREGRVRFQNLRDPHYAFERFTAPPTFDGTPVRPEYPGAPDSTVVHFRLPRPLEPGDSVRVRFAWDARPSTVPRRQGRRGRHFDFAQWYPKVAVYDRGGWQENPLRPAGEFYGEFGTYDVTLTVREDQVIGSTGVPVEGDPGWERVKRWGEVHLMADAYGEVGAGPGSRGTGPGARDEATAPATGADPAKQFGTSRPAPIRPPGAQRSWAGAGTRPRPAFKRVRFVARDVHHFAWSASPAYIYEGGLYKGRIAIHVLYRPGDEAQWAKGQAAERTARALAWLEAIYGPYLYPQVTNLHRLDGGGTEFPMVMMNGSASQGLILHELGHIFTYGMLANNEWRAGWMDEGLTSYQTSWAQGFTLPERAAGKGPPAAPPLTGYRGRAVLPQPHEAAQMDQYRLDLLGRAEPIGTTAHEFSEFVIYNLMIYSRAEQMFGALRDIMGDSTFVQFLRLYYDRWKLKHVDEVAMREAAEAAYGKDLDWFFEQWVHRTGLIDYALTDTKMRREGSGWLTRARIVRMGEYRHSMPVGVLTSGGWTIVRGDPLKREQWVEVRTAKRPDEVRLDPLHVTEDWDRRNDVPSALPLFGSPSSRIVFDWPFLEHADRNRNVVAVTPLAWYSDPGGLNLAARTRTNYQGWIDKRELGVAVALRVPEGARGPDGALLPGADDSSPLSRLQLWATTEHPRLPFTDRPSVGLTLGAWLLDGVAKLDLRKTWDLSRFLFAPGPQRSLTFSLTGTFPYDANWLDPARWDDANVVNFGLEVTDQSPDPEGFVLRGAFRAGLCDGGCAEDFFTLSEFSASKTTFLDERDRAAARVRLFLGQSGETPRQRSIGLSSLDPTETFANHLLRPEGAPLARDDVHYVALGGAGLRGYSPLVRVEDVFAVNVELSRALLVPGQTSPLPQLSLSVFGDVAIAGDNFRDVTTFADAGVGIALRGRVFDRPLRVRADFPLYVRRAELAVGEEDADPSDVGFRWTFSFNDLW